MLYERVGDIEYAKGTGYEYTRVGDTSVFKQTGKVRSLRAIRAKIKKYNNIPGHTISINTDKV